MNFLSSQTIFEALSRRLWFQNVNDVDDVDGVDDVEDFNDSVAEKKSRLEKRKLICPFQNTQKTETPRSRFSDIGGASWYRLASCLCSTLP